MAGEGDDTGEQTSAAPVGHRLTAAKRRKPSHGRIWSARMIEKTERFFLTAEWKQKGNSGAIQEMWAGGGGGQGKKICRATRSVLRTARVGGRQNVTTTRKSPNHPKGPGGD